MSEWKKILMAEDDPNDVELTLNALDRHGLANQVHVVRDGAEALDYLLRRGPFSQRPASLPVVVLLDIKMPKVDGVEVLRQIKAVPELRVVPVVMLTSSCEDSDLEESYRLGANAYVVKPIGFHEFVDAVSELGLFWALINQPPLATAGRKRPPAAFRKGP